MDKIRLSNGYEMPVIGYGTYPQKESLSENIYYAYQKGYRLFDASDNYHNEQYVGQGVQRIDSKDFVIITKYSRSRDEKHFIDAFESSQEKIGKVDIYLLHWPYPFLWKYQWRQMEKLYLEGKVKAIGVCNFEVDKLKALTKYCSIPPMINQIERHPIFQQKDIVSYCKANNIQVMSYSPVARANDELIHNPILKSIADKYNKTVGQVILRWNIDTGTIPIPGASSKTHISENIDIFDFQLTADEKKQINSLESGKRIRFNPKTRFSKVQKIKFFIRRLLLLLKI